MSQPSSAAASEGDMRSRADRAGPRGWAGRRRVGGGLYRRSAWRSRSDHEAFFGFAAAPSRPFSRLLTIASLIRFGWAAGFPWAERRSGAASASPQRPAWAAAGRRRRIRFGLARRGGGGGASAVLSSGAAAGRRRRRLRIVGRLTLRRGRRLLHRLGVALALHDLVELVLGDRFDRDRLAASSNFGANAKPKTRNPSIAACIAAEA